MSGSIKRLLAVSSLVLFCASASMAQQPPSTRIRGQVVAVDGNALTIKARSGDEVKLNLTDTARVMAFVPATLADVKKDSYIGVTAMPDADGTQRAIAVHIFREDMRGTGEGHRPWDLRPNSTMTNAAVDETVAGVDGQVVTVKYKDGEKKVIIGKDTPIVSYASADKTEIKPGTQVIVMAATKAADGSLQADRINIGRGVTPPM